MKLPGLIMALMVLASGCSSGPPPRIYLLNRPLDAIGSSTSVADDGLRLQLSPVLLPDYLDNTELLLRDGPHEITVSATGRWGERLSKGVTHALGAALVTRLPRSSVTLDPAVDHSYRQIAVDIDSFDLWADGRCVLSAIWTISAGDAKAASSNGRGVYQLPATSRLHRVSDADIVSAMSEALGKLADSIILDTKNPMAASVNVSK